MDKKYFHPQADFYRKVLNVDAPETIPHLTEDEIKDKLKPMLPAKWHLEGNKLIAVTENGTHAQMIDPSYILVGTDENQLPILKKIVL